MAEKRLVIGDQVAISDIAQLWDGPLFRGYYGVIIGFGDAAGVPDFPGDKTIGYEVARVCLWEPREIVLTSVYEIDVVKPFKHIRRTVMESKAADILNVRLSYMDELLNDHKIDWHVSNRTSTMRLIYYDDLMRYKEKRDRMRRDAISDITGIGADYERGDREWKW